jgi:hypothetical protein
MKSAMPIILLFGLLCFFVLANWLNRPYKKKDKDEE